MYCVVGQFKISTWVYVAQKMEEGSDVAENPIKISLTETQQNRWK